MIHLQLLIGFYGFYEFGALNELTFHSLAHSKLEFDTILAMQYSPLSTEDVEADTSSSESKSTDEKKINPSLRNDRQVPITRPPAKQRDRFFVLLFLLHFGTVASFVFFEKKENQISLISNVKAGMWSSIVMIITLLGSFFGALVIFMVSNSESREPFLSLAVPFSIVIQICLGNILLLFRSIYSPIGVLFLVSAYCDSCRYKQVRDNLSFTSALIGLVENVCRHFGVGLTIACVGIVAVQTCVLLWWGVFLVDLLAHIPTDYVHFLVLGMAFSLLWTMQFFHALMAYVIGGCVVWYFVRDDDQSLDGSNRVTMHLRCAMTCGLGSLCKGALLCPLCEVILSFHAWSKGRVPGSTRCTSKDVVAMVISPLVGFAQKHTRLAYCLTATYGLTLCKAADNHNRAHPRTLDMALEDVAVFTLDGAVTAVAGVASIVFGVFAGRKEGATLPLFLFVVYYLAYSGVSLCLTVYRAAFDALLVVFAIKPESLARENQIIYLRFVRTSEPVLS